VTEKCLSTINEAHSDIIFNLELTNEGNLISCSVDKNIKFWDIEKNTCLKSIKEYGRVFSILYMKENDHLICGLGKSGNIDVWNISNSDYIGAFIGHNDIVRCLKLLKNKNLVSCSDDKTIKIWNTLNGELIKTLVGHQGSVSNLELMDNGNLISCSRDKTIKIWDLNRYVCIKSIKANAKKIKIMKNGNLICGSNGNIKIIDIERGICVKTMSCHASSFEILNE
jgi:WD40 repeat protein